MRFLAFLFVLFMLTSQSDARIRFLKELDPLVEEEISLAKSKLNVNHKISKDDLEELKSSLDNIWCNLKTFGFSETKGREIKLRPSYVIMQGILEKAQFRAYKSGLVDSVDAYIITPKMPTPLTMDYQIDLSKVRLEEPRDFSAYRVGILKSFLNSGCFLNAVYCQEAVVPVSSNTDAGKVYRKHCRRYKNLKDLPLISLPMTEFPVKISGALYYIDGHPIAIESRQISLSDNSVTQVWSIRFDKYADGRIGELNQFLKENGREEIILPKSVR
ncbi:MAG: hypothetical protein RSB82_01755 [Victivallaceae bacterium]